MLNRIREWTCEDCTDGLVKIAEMFAQPTFIEDSITFLQVTKIMVIMMQMMQILFNPKTVKSQIQGGIYSVKSAFDTNMLVTE